MKAFKENIKKEISAGKPPKQSVAIAYAVKRDAAAKKTSKSKGKQKWWDPTQKHKWIKV